MAYFCLDFTVGITNCKILPYRLQVHMAVLQNIRPHKTGTVLRIPPVIRTFLHSPQRPDNGVLALQCNIYRRALRFLWFLVEERADDGGRILIIVLVEYIPFFLNIGPGADVLFGSTFGGPFMLLLILFAPQVVVFSLIGTYAYRKTGSVYTGALLIASMACWIVTGGSSMM